MHVIFTLLALIFGIGSIVCWFIVLIDAFQDEVWKGLVCILCGFYWLYYAIIDFDHEKKWTIVLTAIFGGTLASIFQILAR